MPSARRIFTLLELLARRGPLGTRAIAREIGIPLGSAHRLLHELELEEAVARDDDGEWNLSFRPMHITGLHMARLQLPTVARPYLERIAAETKETTFLAVPGRNEIVYVDTVQSDMQLQMNVQIGTRRPLHCTGLGKAILAFLSQEKQRDILSRGELIPFTPNTITDPILLYRELELVRQRGYAIDREEIILGVHCIAVPVLDYRQLPIGAISIAGAGPNSESPRFDSLVKLMLDVGRDVSKRFGAQQLPGDTHRSTPAEIDIEEVSAAEM